MSSSRQLSFGNEPATTTASAHERHDLGEGCVLELQRDFAAGDHTARMDALVAAVPWVQELYFRGARAIPAPRLTSFHGDPGCGYTYSGIRYEPVPWLPELSQLRVRLIERTGVAFNCVLCNLYRDGRDSVGWHADDERELGPSRDDVAIGSVSLGAPRRFVFKHRRDGRRLGFELGEGSLLLMRGRTQQHWVHALPKTARPAGPRLNLTFRVVMAR